MKFRKVLAAALCLSLGMGLCVPTLAANAADERLAKVTQTVKATLGVGDEYTEFYGEPNETYLGTKWELSWSGEDSRLNVSATGDGKVLSMNRSMTSSDWREDGFGPSFPAMTRDEALAKAEAFMKKVLAKGETAVFDDSRESSAGLDVRQYGFGGIIYLNGLSTPMSFRVWVSVEQEDVTSFRRDDESGYAGSVPAAQTSTTAAKARSLLRDTLDLELIYVRDSKDEKAVLRYVPRSTDDYYVDAATGKLVNLTELRQELYKNAAEGGGMAAPEMAANTSMAADRNGLTQAELEGISKLEGALDKNELDKLVRAWKELKLDGFELSGCSYFVERKDSGLTVMPIAVNVKAVPEVEAPVEETAPADAKVTASLTYNKLDGERVSRRSVTVDAKTGELLSMTGYDPYNDAAPKVSVSAAQKTAESFLKKLWPEQVGKCDVYTSTAAEYVGGAHRFTYAQKENGYFFPANSISVRVSANDGAILGFSKSFDDDVVFDSADGLIDLDKAKTVWCDSFPVELSYLAVPVKLDLMGPEVKPLISAGYSYFNALKPGYELGQQETYYRGVDAKTGELVKEPAYETQEMTYSDLSGHWAEAALNELAQYNVGWFGGKADPDGALTQLDYLALLASADGYRYIPGESSTDDLYDYAVRRGLLTKADRQDDKVLARGEMVKLLLDSLGYKAVANLPGIFRCDFADADAISQAELGYAALAQGLGIVSGGPGGSYDAARSARRSEAAVMLWKYMKR